MMLIHSKEIGEGRLQGAPENSDSQPTFAQVRLGELELVAFKGPVKAVRLIGSGNQFFDAFRCPHICAPPE